MLRPALSTSTSIPPNCSSAAEAATSTPAGVVRSRSHQVHPGWDHSLVAGNGDHVRASGSETVHCGSADATGSSGDDGACSLKVQV